MNRAQQARKKRLERFGANLQDRMSTSYMDVRRQVGATIREVYSNIVVHAARRNIDNPDPQAVSSVPVIMSLSINMPIETDVRNGDILIIKRVDERGQITDAWRGVAGDPYTTNSRKRLFMDMSALARDNIIDDVTPPPLPDEPDEGEYSEITINFADDVGNPIRAAIVTKHLVGKEVTIEALEIHGWIFTRTEWRGETYNIDSITFTPTDPEYSVSFVYDRVATPVYLRPFANSRFRQSDGTLVTTGNLAHWYRRIDFDWIGEENGTMTISISIPPLNQNASIIHQETRGAIQFRAGTRVKVFPQEFYAEIRTVTRAGDAFTMQAIEVEPTSTERGATATQFYDWTDD